MSRVFAECQEAGLPEIAWFCLSENASVPWQQGLQMGGSGEMV
jgi:hypothetical protein